jgi:hypothetical protein
MNLHQGRGGHWLQYLYFALGTAEVALVVLLLSSPEKNGRRISLKKYEKNQ